MTHCYRDRAVKSLNKEILVQLVAGHINVLGPLQGRAAASGTDEFGNPFEILAAGDPDYWYAAVRNACGDVLPEGIEDADPDEAAQVLGVWA